VVTKMSYCCSTTLCGDRLVVELSIAKGVVKVRADRSIVKCGRRQQTTVEMEETALKSKGH
jgi:hypothetical protein